jgi:U3 small nucleolar RNA-associated protein 14
MEIEPSEDQGKHEEVNEEKEMLREYTDETSTPVLIPERAAEQEEGITPIPKGSLMSVVVLIVCEGYILFY